jgi:hypothetical protein
VPGAVGGCGWVRAAASPSVLTDKLLQVKKPKFIRVRPLCRNQHEKTTGCGILRLSRTTLECRQKGKFWVRAKFAFLHNQAASIHKIFKGWKDIYVTYSM